MAIGRIALLLAGIAALVLGGASLILGQRESPVPVAAVTQEPGAVALEEPGLVGLWTFDETDSAVALDASSNSNDGIVVAPTGSPAWGEGGFAGSVKLGGAERSFVSVAASESLNALTDAITVVVNAYPVELWTPGAPYDGHIVLVQRQWRKLLHPDLFYLGYGPAGDVLTYKWHVGLMDEGPAIYERTETRTPTVGEWVHLAGVYDGTTGEMSLYVDGELIANRTLKGRISIDEESLGRPLMIGAELNGNGLGDTSGPFNGYVDEVRIYDRALTAAEIGALASRAKARHSGG